MNTKSHPVRSYATRLAVVVAALSMAGCSTPTRVDKGNIDARTFSFVNGGVAANPNPTDRRQAFHQMIQESITHHLKAKGVSLVPRGGDVTVSYLVIVGNNASTETIRTYYSEAGDAGAFGDKAFDAYTSSKNPNYFEAGTLLIELLDSRTFKLLHRNYAVRPILRDPSMEVRAARIQEAVDEALNRVQTTR
jgi:hypothetical protein